MSSSHQTEFDETVHSNRSGDEDDESQTAQTTLLSPLDKGLDWKRPHFLSQFYRKEWISPTHSERAESIATHSHRSKSASATRTSTSTHSDQSSESGTSGSRSGSSVSGRVDNELWTFCEKPAEWELQRAFRNMDPVGAGLLSIDELLACVEELGLHNAEPLILEQLNGIEVRVDDGNVNYAEFRSAILGPLSCEKLTVARLWQTFDEFDVDNSGQLTWSEFNEACEYLGFAEGENTKKYFKHVDYLHSGSISFPEFVRAMTGREPTQQEIRDAVLYEESTEACK